MLKTIYTVSILGVCGLSAAEKPKLLFIFADDHACEAIYSACRKSQRTVVMDGGILE